MRTILFLVLVMLLAWGASTYRFHKEVTPSAELIPEPYFSPITRKLILSMRVVRLDNSLKTFNYDAYDWSYLEITMGDSWKASIPIIEAHTSSEVPYSHFIDVQGKPVAFSDHPETMKLLIHAETKHGEAQRLFM